MKTQSAFILFLVTATSAAPNPEITIAAVLPRQLTTEIVGYFSANGVWNTYYCNPSWHYCTSGSYAACGTVLDTTCNVPITCTSTSMMVDRLGKTNTCSVGTNTVCGTNTVYQTPGDTKGITSLVCRPSGQLNLVLYRSFSASTTSSSGGLASLTSAQMSPSMTPTIPTSTSSPSPTSIEDDPTPAKSKAWIAGPVIAVLAVIAGIVFGVLFFRRKRSSQSAMMPQTGTQQHPGLNQPVLVQEHKPQAGYYEQKMPPMVDAHEQQYYPHSPQPSQPPQGYMHGGNVNHISAAELGPRY